MSFHNVQLDPTLSIGAQGGPRWSTTVQTTASGHEYRIARQGDRRVYEFDKTLLDETEAAALLEFVAARRGHLHGFRFKDWGDYSSAANHKAAPSALDQIIGTGDGTTTQFQLLKTYDVAGSNPLVRPITLPVAGTLLVAIDGTPTTSFTLTNPGGLITFSAAPTASAVITAGFQFDVPVRFNVDSEWARLQLDRGLLTSWSRIGALELLNEVESPDQWDPGGSADPETITSDVTITFQNKVWTFTAAGGTPAVILPNPAREVGGEYFRIINSPSSSVSLQVKDHEGNNVGSSFGAGAIREVLLTRSGSTATWWLR